jgi:hypothetical protein
MASPEVTDHAVLRYLERHEGIDVEAVRRRIARQVRRAAEMQAMGVLAGGMTYRLVGGVVVSCWRTCEPDVRTGRARGRRGHVDG